MFCVKSTGPRAREREVSQANGFSQFFLRILGWGREHAAASQPNSFPNFYGDRPVPIGQMRSDDRSLLKKADSRVIFSMKLVDRKLSEEKIIQFYSFVSLAVMQILSMFPSHQRRTVGVE